MSLVLGVVPNKTCSTCTLGVGTLPFEMALLIHLMDDSTQLSVCGIYPQSTYSEQVPADQAE